MAGSPNSVGRAVSTHGQLTREVTWYVGQPDGAATRNPAIR
jgi:hypothetical protein